MLLQRHQVLQGIDTRLATGGNEARQDAGNVGTVLRSVKQRVLALPNEKFLMLTEFVVIVSDLP